MLRWHSSRHGLLPLQAQRSIKLADWRPQRGTPHKSRFAIAAKSTAAKGLKPGF
ncbi:MULTISPECIES: hypothetical protein [unclassified Sphingopyxis]|jgi:hypothetical protein|uniref:hypothetical protein n=1 Tax=unclassified Sphingopyxis TaxID=2614943 RepID=UPI000B254936|nr:MULTISPECIES: hypothetical protein [unclassified Sphingopyxis]